VCIIFHYPFLDMPRFRVYLPLYRCLLGFLPYAEGEQRTLRLVDLNLLPLHRLEGLEELLVQHHHHEICSPVVNGVIPRANAGRGERVKGLLLGPLVRCGCFAAARWRRTVSATPTRAVDLLTIQVDAVLDVEFGWMWMGLIAVSVCML
jgi:hypothetical protein